MDNNRITSIMVYMVDNMLDFASIKNGTFEKKIQDFDI